MRLVANLLVVSVISCAAAIAQDKGAPNAADQAHARMQAQAAALQNSKMQQAQHAKNVINSDAARKKAAIDQHLKQQHNAVDAHVRDMFWLHGDQTHAVGQHTKRQMEEHANAQKQAIANEAQRKAAQHTAAAHKAAESLNQSVDGLKSQVSKDGKFGLKPASSSLHVRTYGAH